MSAFPMPAGSARRHASRAYYRLSAENVAAHTIILLNAAESLTRAIFERYNAHR